MNISDKEVIDVSYSGMQFLTLIDLYFIILLGIACRSLINHPLTFNERK
jgi:hypothetical protein